MEKSIQKIEKLLINQGMKEKSHSKESLKLRIILNRLIMIHKKLKKLEKNCNKI